MKLAIVGSTCVKDTFETRELIKSWILKLQPTVVVSGGASGVDSIAVATAKDLKIKTMVFLPKQQNWRYFKERNLQIADECDVLLRIVSKRSKTYGSGWTRDQAKKLGKLTYEVIVD